jgi:hypothetical protein
VSERVKRPPKRTMNTEQAQALREARVYEAMARFCSVGTRSGITSMTISSGDKSTTITREDGPRMAANARKIAAAFRAKAERHD